MRIYCLSGKEKLHFSRDGIDRTPQGTDAIKTEFSGRKTTTKPSTTDHTLFPFLFVSAHTSSNWRNCSCASLFLRASSHPGCSLQISCQPLNSPLRFRNLTLHGVTTLFRSKPNPSLYIDAKDADLNTQTG